MASLHTPVNDLAAHGVYQMNWVTNTTCSDSVDQYLTALKLTTRFYRVNYVRRGNLSAYMRFVCLENYHLAEGSFLMHCLPNNTWDGEEPRCEVDAHMEKKRLSTLIALISFIIPAAWLFLDFFRFMRDRRRRRAVTSRPAQPRCRVQGIATTVSKKDIARDILTTIMSSVTIDASMEDIFQNKTVSAKASTKISTGQSHFQMLGAARAFGHIGKIITRDMF